VTYFADSIADTLKWIDEINRNIFLRYF
jgi:hypothetical protein